jgi:hypothetical protein
MNIQSIKVKTVDTEKLIDFLGIILPENEKLEIDRFAIFEDKFQINPDCCFSEIVNFHFENKAQPNIQISCRVKKLRPDGSFKIRMDHPDFTKLISVESYNSLATEVNLVDFIRFNYNPRIMGNQQLLMKYIRE